MNTIFLTCLAIGGVVLVAQLLLSLAGLGDGGGHDGAHDAEHHAGDSLVGLHLFSVRSLAAAVAFFGVGGLAARALAAPAPVAVLIALAAGVTASLATATIMRSLLRLEEDGSLRLERAVGAAATVYIPVPAAGGGPGKVLLTLQGRTVECQAVTGGALPLPTGTPVTVVDVRAADLVEVVPTPPIDGVP